MASLRSLTTLGMVAALAAAGCTVDDPPPKPKTPQKKAAVPTPPPPKPPPKLPSPAERAKVAYQQLRAALVGGKRSEVLGLLSKVLRAKHGDEAIWRTVQAHRRRYPESPLDAFDVGKVEVRSADEGVQRVVMGFSTVVFAPAVAPPEGADAEEQSAAAATLRARFVGVRTDTRFETYTVLQIAPAGLLSSAPAGKKRAAEQVKQRPLLRAKGR